MAEEPQPQNIHEGATADEAPPLPSNAEDRKAAAALSSLDARGEEDDASSKGKHVDTEALGKAMKRLDVSGAGAKGKEVGKEKAAVKKIKIDSADVALIVDELMLSKGKATELLKQHDGDAVKAMIAYVTAPV